MSRPRPLSPEPAASAAARGISLYRSQMLAYNLPGAMAAILAARLGDVPGEHLDGYLRLRWLRWECGRLRLTPAGSRVCAAAA